MEMGLTPLKRVGHFIPGVFLFAHTYLTQGAQNTLVGKVMTERPLSKGAVKGILLKGDISHGPPLD